MEATPRQVPQDGGRSSTDRTATVHSRCGTTDRRRRWGCSSRKGGGSRRGKLAYASRGRASGNGGQPHQAGRAVRSASEEGAEALGEAAPGGAPADSTRDSPATSGAHGEGGGATAPGTSPVLCGAQARPPGEALRAQGALSPSPGPTYTASAPVGCVGPPASDRSGGALADVQRGRAPTATVSRQLRPADAGK